MGATFSNIHIRNNKKINPDQFIQKLSNYMKTKGFIPATEDESELWYSFAPSKSNDWIALHSSQNEEPDDEAFKEDAKGLAKSMKTISILAKVIDSDMVILDYFDETGTLKNQVVKGSSAYHDADSIGNPDFWKPLFVGGHTWEEWQEAWGAEHVFAEDALPKMMPLIGMNEEAVRMSCGFPSEELKSRTVTVHFKKATKTGKTQSLNSAFKQIYGEALEPLGFVKLKGKYPYFLRLIGDEILHIITYVNEWTGREPEYKAFDIVSGVATVYRHHIDLSTSPKDNTAWLNTISNLCFRSQPSDCNEELYKSLFKFTYKVDDESMLHELKRSLEAARKIILPLLDKVTGLESCVKYLDEYGKYLIIYDETKQFGNVYANDFYNEGLLYVKMEYRGDFLEKLECREEYIAYPSLRIGDESYEEYHDRSCKYASERRNKLDGILNNRDVYTKALAELERRKEANTETLRNYGLI